MTNEQLIMFQDFETFCQLPLHYIIVGGGTAGLAVAARLSEDPEVNVGVIEAGPSAVDGEDGGAITVPGRYGETIGSKYDWQFETTPQPGLGGRSLKWPRGRVLGGTSALNFMAWNRGHREDYDAWARLGNQGWGWDELL
jgi:choline dehydrogenase-like flavoprotein